MDFNILPPMANKFLFTIFFIAFCRNIFVVKSAVFTVRNNCGFDIWPGTTTGRGTPTLTGFHLRPHESQSLTASPPWSGNVWARTQCSGSAGNFSCATADCATGNVECGGKGGKPPISLAEFTLAGADNKDFFDISLVDGFNLPVSVQPSSGGCPAPACAADVNAACPSELSLRDAGGRVIGCKSACVAFGDPKYCCTGSSGSPQTCAPTSYSKFFKGRCPQAYSYAYDDATSTFTCPTGGNYVITFCP